MPVAFAVLLAACGDAVDLPPDEARIESIRQSFTCGSIKLGHRLTHFGDSSVAPGKLYQTWFTVDPCSGAVTNNQTAWFPITVAADARPFGPHMQTSGTGMSSWDKNYRRDAFYVSTTGTVAHVFTNDRGLSWGADDWGKPAGYNIYGQVGVTSWGPGRVDVFVLGKTAALDSTSSSGNALFHRSWDNGVASAWQTVGPAPYAYDSNYSQDTGVTATSWGPGRIDIFAKNTGASLFHWYSNDGASFASDVWPTASASVGAPDVASWGDQRLDVFYETWIVTPHPGYPSSVTNSLRHVWWDHGAFGEDDWGDHSSVCANYGGGVMAGLLGAAAKGIYGKAWLAPSWSCGANLLGASYVPVTQHIHKWTVDQHGWLEVTPTFGSVIGKYPWAARGDGALTVTDTNP